MYYSYIIHILFIKSSRHSQYSYLARDRTHSGLAHIIHTLFIHYSCIIHTLFIHYSYIIHTLFIHYSYKFNIYNFYKIFICLKNQTNIIKLAKSLTSNKFYIHQISYTYIKNKLRRNFYNYLGFNLQLNTLNTLKINCQCEYIKYINAILHHNLWAHCDVKLCILNYVIILHENLKV